jgi:hypothetical protein
LKDRSLNAQRVGPTRWPRKKDFPQLLGGGAVVPLQSRFRPISLEAGPNSGFLMLFRGKGQMADS